MKKLSLGDKELINSFYEKSQIELGYCSFTGEISVSHGHGYEVYHEFLEDSLFYIEEDPSDRGRNLVPVFIGKELMDKPELIRQYIHDERINSFSYIDRSFVRSLESTLKLEPDSESEHEVIYPIGRFRDFKEIDSQRRQANIFFRNNNYNFSPYDGRNSDLILKLAEHWERTSAHPTDGCDTKITKFFTENFNKLGILGFNLLVNDNVEGYIFGEKINHRTFVIYSIKANRKFKGIYQALFNLVCSHPSFEDVDFINNTNLTEVEGLRESKLRLKPSKMIVPWVANLQ